MLITKETEQNSCGLSYVKVKGEVVLLRTMKTCRWRRGIAAHIRKLGIRLCAS